MGKNRKQFHNKKSWQSGNSSEGFRQIDEQQHRHHKSAQAVRNSKRSHRLPRLCVTVLLENGESFDGKAVAFSNRGEPACKVLFKCNGQQELGIITDISINALGPEKISVIQSSINNFLIQLHEESNMEFPEWLEKYSTRVGETNPCFNLDEIREEFKFKKTRFGMWRKAANLGFFTDMKPQIASFNKIVRIDISESKE